MKHKLSFVASLWWVILCAIAGIFLLALTNPKERVSYTENRVLAGFPELSVKTVSTGEFMAGFEDFLSDGFFERDRVVEATEALMDRFSLLSEDEKLAVEAREMEKRLAYESTLPARQAAEEAAPAEEAPPAQADLAETALSQDMQQAAPDPDAGDAAAAPVPQAPEADDAPGQSAVPEADAGDDGAASDEEDEPEENITLKAGDVPLNATYSYLWLERANGDKDVIYKYENSKIKTYAETLKLMQTYLPDDGVICFTQVPLASIANRWRRSPRYYTSWGSSVETVLEKCLEGTERIYVFNTFAILEPYVDGPTRMFYVTDHHWSVEGAYMVYCEMMKRQNLPVITYEEYSFKAIKGNVHNGNRDTFQCLIPPLPVHSYVVRKIKDMTEISLMNYKSPTYLCLMNNTRLPWRRIITQAHTGRKCLVICDSFGNAFTPFLLAYYDEVHMCDFRYSRYDKHETGGSIGYLLKYYGIDDVYIVTSTANGLRKDNSIKFLRQYLVG